jgi:ribosome-associated translation inhibitor RaiA
MTVNPVETVVLHTRGEVTSADRTYAVEKVTRVLDAAPAPVLHARVDLTQHADPARARPSFATAALDVNGRRLGARVEAATMHEAIDLLQARLAERLARLSGHAEAAHLRHRGHDEHEWRHGDPPTARPGYFPRPVEEREVVRRRSFAPAPMTTADAVNELQLLDDEFFLFTNLATGEDNLVACGRDGGYELFEPNATRASDDDQLRHSAVRPPVLDEARAIELLDAGDGTFVFYVDAASGRGHVVYHRYDGHYGVITPTDAAG